MIRLSEVIFALSSLSVAALCQEGQRAEPFALHRVRPPKPMVYDLANKKVVRNGIPQKSFIGMTFCYIDTDTVGFFTSASGGETFIDWGILGGTATTQCADLSNIVSNFNFAYGTTMPDTSVAGPGASLTITFYTNWKGFCGDMDNAPVATFSFSGMPGFSGTSTGIGAGYAFTVDLSGGFEFCMPDGRFGYGYAGDGLTGPFLVQTGDGAGGPEPATGNLDVFDIWVPDTSGVCLGSFSFGGPPNDFSSWYGQIARAEIDVAAVAFRNCLPNKPGSLACSAAVLGSTLSFTVLSPGKAFATLFAFDTPHCFALSGGQVLLCIDFGGNGEMLTGNGLATPPTGIMVGGCIQFATVVPVPKDLNLCGFSLCVQAIMFGPSPFALSNACDLTIGG